jgi:hypothetical protein
MTVGPMHFDIGDDARMIREFLTKSQYNANIISPIDLSKTF